MHKFAYVDFEFRNTKEAKLHVVSVAILLTEGGKEICRDSVWLADGVAVADTRDYFKKIFFEEGYTLVAYVTEAEARALFSIGVDARKIKTIDLYVEYRNLLNHNHALAYGKQYLNGEVIDTTPPPPKWERNDEDNEPHHKPSYSLAAACYKLLQVKIDAAEKDEVRNIIIHGTDADLEANRTRILKYNESDITHLPALLRRMISVDCHYREGLTAAGAYADNWIAGAIERGKYSIHAATMLARGYPINVEKLEKFEKNTGKILLEAARECNLAAASEGFAPFKWNRKTEGFSISEKPIREWVARQGFPHWRQTEQKKPSLSKDAFGDWFNSQSPGFAGAFCRYLKTKQSLNGFLPVTPGSGKRTFRDFLGSDGRVRPFMGIYGSQSSRSQPGAVGFIPLKAHWMRNFIEAPPGAALVSLDYASQEFLLAAILSQDSDMLKAYASGDVYLAFGKAAGIIPTDATKKSHPVEREGCKATVLGISYDMTEHGLAPRLQRALGRPVSTDEARHYIDTFYEVYSDFAEWKKETQLEYVDDGYLSLPDGWTMWADNDNHRSVGNFPVQGHGAVIMRRAVALAEAAGVRVIYTLHDALTAEYAAFDFDKVKALENAMQQAFLDVMAPYGETVPIRIEGETWSPDYSEKENKIFPNLVAMKEYSDNKGMSDLSRYRKFFT
jgi:hypothetical protein